MLSHLTNSRPKFPFFSSFEVNRFSGAVRGQSVHRVIGTGPYTGHVERGADEEVDISPERKKQRNWSRGRRTRRWGKKQRNCSICSMPLSVRWRRGEGEANQDASRGSRMPAPHLTGGVWRLVGSDGGRSTLGFGGVMSESTGLLGFDQISNGHN